MTSTNLVEQLKQTWPVENIEPYGKVLVVPSRSFQPQWEEQLKTLGITTFMQAHKGESAFFIRLDKHHSKFRKHWTETETAQLKELLSQNLTFSEIADKLGRSKGSVLGKVQRLRLNRFPTDKLEPNPSIGENIVKEYLACVSELYPRYPHVCANLLKEASQKILGAS